MMTALCELARKGPRPAHTEIVFAGLVDEENNQLGSRALADSGFTADLAIVGEPTGCQLITAHKGDLWLELTTHGQAAHGATPHLGKNAVHAMARLVEVLETEYAKSLRRRRHPLLGTGTVNVGTIRGGSQPNIVPDRCTIAIDRRTLPGETETGVHRELRVLLRRHRLAADISNAKGAECPALETDPKLPLVSCLMKLLGQKRPLGVHYFCDAAVLAGGGVPSVVFGPGDIAQAHTADEWISLAQLERAQGLLVQFLSALP
jgi:acetylornithine deacetylase/succinyl-diaminopimelate desuccinylase-like protein